MAAPSFRAGHPVPLAAGRQATKNDAPGRAAPRASEGHSKTNASDCARPVGVRKHGGHGEPPPFEPTSPAKAKALREILKAGPGVGATTQMRRMVLGMLQLGEVSRLEAEQFLGIGHAPRRVLDLIESGFLIGKRWVVQLSASGTAHRTVLYSILAAPEATK